MLQTLILLPLMLSAQSEVPAAGIPDAIVVDESLVTVTIIKTVRVPAREEGELEELNYKEGANVKAGDEIGRLNKDLVEIERDRVAADVEIAEFQATAEVNEKFAQASYEVALADLNRAIRAREAFEKSFSKSELEQLELLSLRAMYSEQQAVHERKVAMLTEKFKRHELRLRDKRIQRRNFVSPINGRIVEVFRQPGEWLNPGEPLVRIIQLDKLRVEAFVDGKKYGQELLNKDVELTVTLPPGDRTAVFTGKVVFVSPELQPVTGDMKIWAEVENESGELRPGARGELKVMLK